MKNKRISIEGAIEVPEGISMDEVTERMEEWIGSQGWHLLAVCKEAEEKIEELESAAWAAAEAGW